MQYRREIDGLRAVAVIPVILFHAGFELFSGGFVGVDIFFVISGYLITTLITEEIDEGHFSILNFYQRRARRILPALFFVMLVCIPFAVNWMLPSQLRDFSGSLIAVALFFSNFLFWSQSGYFEAAADLKPLLHTWSLAVEEQYYLFFPVLLVLVFPLGRSRVYWTVGVIAAMSFLFSDWGSRNDSDANFFLPFSRVWELFAGSMCAFILSQKDIRGNNSFALVGLIAIAASILLFNEKTPFPGVFALLPVGGAVLLILFGNARTFTGIFLSNRIFVGVGLLSYSAYLWHQPLFAFVRIRLPSPPDTSIMILLCVASFILAAVSWKLVEQPFRNRRGILQTRGKVFGVSGLGIITFVAIGGFGVETDFFEKRFLATLSKNDLELYSYIDYLNRPEWQTSSEGGRCFVGSFEAIDKDYCLNHETDAFNVLLLGDSHAAHYSGAFRQVFPEINLLQATKNGCAPVFRSREDRGCDVFNEAVMRHFQSKEEKLDVIVLSARWRDEHKFDIRRTERRLRQYTNSVVFMGPTVEYYDPLPIVLINALGRKFASVSESVDIERFALDKEMRRIVENSSAVYQSIVDILCKNDTNDCTSQDEFGVPITFDYGHFTLNGASHVVKRLNFTGEWQ